MAPETPRRCPLLDRLSLEEKQRLVNNFWSMSRPWLQVFAQDPHRPLKPIEVSLPIGRSVLVSLTPAEISTLCPPDPSVAHLIDLDDPPFPLLWVCWWHGKQIRVDTPEALAEAKTRPGYGPTPEGPWLPAGFSAPPTWACELGKGGPFAPAPDSEKNAPYPPGGSRAVHARHPLFYNRRAYFTGQIFLLEDLFEDHDRKKKEDVVEVSFSNYRVQHAPTGLWFMDEPRHAAYVQIYETGDVTPWLKACAPEGTLGGQTTTGRLPLGRTPESGTIYPGDDFLTTLETVIDDLWIEGKGKVRPTVTMIAMSKHWSNSISRATIYNRLKPYGIILRNLISSRKDIALSRNV